MNTRKIRAGMPAPQDIPWPEPEVIEDNEVSYLGWVVFALALLLFGVLFGFMLYP